MPAVSTNARDIFLSALDQANPTQRAAFISQACAGDVALQRHVEALLRAHDEPDSLLDQPRISLQASDNKGAGSPATIDHSPTEAIGTLIGPYKLLEQIGEGGMGLVYMAEQQRPMRRLVALKIIKPGMDTKQVIARFEAEKQALAMMDHQNIAKVFDAGTTDTGRPYFAMELVRGIPINEFCDQKRLAVRERLGLVVQVCEAIQHAHQKGIIHRDLKPTNVLVTLADTIPVPKVIDFGIAKALGAQLTEHTLHTGFAQLIGTPIYMSPEQAELNQFGVDTCSDVYSLGVMLYELLTGTTPFDKETLTKVSFDEMRRIIREVEPETVSVRLAKTRTNKPGVDAEVNRRVHAALPELDWIVSKSLEKDRSLRYESASALAADIQRYLTDEPVLACPPSTTYRFRKFARKHRGWLTTAGLLAASLLFGITFSVWQAVRAIRAETRAKSNESLALAEEARARLQGAKAVAAANAERMARQAEMDQRQRAEKGEQQAQRNFEAALDAVDRFLEHLGSDELYEVPFVQQTRRKVLEDAIKFYEQFLTQSDNSPRIRYRLARTWPRMAYLLQELGDDGNPGDTDNLAKKCNDAGLSLIEQLVAEEPDNFDYLNLLADNCASCYTHPSSDAQQLYRRAAEIYRRLAKTGRQPTHSSPICYGSFTDRYVEGLLGSGQYDLALEVTERSVVSKRRRADALFAKAQQLRRTSPDVAYPLYKECIDALHEWMAEPRGRDHDSIISYKIRNAGSAIAVEHPAEGEALLREALDLIRPLATHFPHNRLYQRRLAEALQALGGYFRQQSAKCQAKGDTERAIQLLSEADSRYVEAIAVARKIAMAFRGQLRDLLSQLLFERANVALALAHESQPLSDANATSKTGQADARATAASLLEEAIQLCRGLAAEFPDNAAYRNRLAAILKLQAQHLGKSQTDSSKTPDNAPP